MAKPILCVDFDGVLHSYTSGWKGADVIPDDPVPGAVAFLSEAKDHFRVCVFSSRSNQPGGIEAMRRWLEYHIRYHFDCVFAPGSPRDFDQAEALISTLEFPTEKPAAMVTLDDRAVTFQGVFPPIWTLLEFKPWNKREIVLQPNGAGPAAAKRVARRIRFIQMVNRLMPRWATLVAR